MPALLDCAPLLDPRLTTSLMQQESTFNPNAIGLDGKEYLFKKPKNRTEAISITKELLAKGKKFSVGLSQVHIENVKRFGLTLEQAFDPCTNIFYGQKILVSFHNQALKAGFKGRDAVYAALRGYNSGKITSTISNSYAASILSRIENTEGTIVKRGAEVQNSEDFKKTSQFVKAEDYQDRNDIFYTEAVKEREGDKKHVFSNGDIFGD
ncbi:Type IV secretion system protein virB1 (plasmid) [Janthinobacterium sp. HH102]|uniref:transglycosylase SLT domain-containing protein n=1 Tax=Janthinobacterium sp. HH102 TaxID=1537274 RepID=UPI000893893A|nr:transglycosylase SLT domain-containing protein [Janthinobacterium sp. HH102]QOU76442.1 Type IV secretion system protein virB1 [Janthinobacterium sp. HH102]